MAIRRVQCEPWFQVPRPRVCHSYELTFVWPAPIVQHEQPDTLSIIVCLCQPIMHLSEGARNCTLSVDLSIRQELILTEPVSVLNVPRLP